MTQVETVALWCGLIGSVAGIVLSILAITVSILSDRRSERISASTIQSLQKIETAVAQQTDDTRQLIKAAWDKLLGAVDRQMSEPGLSPTSAKSVAQGIAAELRDELRLAAIETTSADTVDRPPKEERIGAVVNSLENSLEGLLRQKDGGLHSELDALVNSISSLSPEAQALLQLIRPKHVTREQYRRLMSTENLRRPVMELRGKGLIIPVQPHKGTGDSSPSYYYPPWLAQSLRRAFPLAPEIPNEVEEAVRADLKAAGYPKPTEG